MFFATDFLKNEEIRLVLEKTVEADPARGWLPAYHFAICDLNGVKMGTCDLRVGHNENVYYGGNIGYRVEEPYRGHHYAGKACRLLFELARRHGMEYLIITCNPDNWPSRKTCEYAGGELVEIAELPEDNDMRVEDGESSKCIYKFRLWSADEITVQIERLFYSFIHENKLNIGISYCMPKDYETAFGTFDITRKTLFLNPDTFLTCPKYEVFFYLFHELRHAMQYIHPEAFGRSIRQSIPYVILYNGDCFKLLDDGWRYCKLEGDADYFTCAYENLPYELDANQYAYKMTMDLFPDDAEKLNALYKMWAPKGKFTDDNYRALFARIDSNM